MDLTFLSQADSVTIKYELAKAALETARSNLDAAKLAYDDLLSQADSYGIPKAKLKKLTEDRVQALLDSGLLSAVRTEGAKAPEAKRGRKATRGEAANSDSATEMKAGPAEEETETLGALESDADQGEARA